LLTHTHAGIAALATRLAKNGVPQERYVIETISGWCLRYATAYPSVSRLPITESGEPNWSQLYPAALRLFNSELGRRVLRESFAGVLVDEYQDCSLEQHDVMMSIARTIPCRAVGDPLQSIFGFREPVVSWTQIKNDFSVLPDTLATPWRWTREQHNRDLGAWLRAARSELRSRGCVRINAGSPVNWIRTSGPMSLISDGAAGCRDAASTYPEDSVVAILKWPGNCVTLARRLGGRWPMVERFDQPDLPALAVAAASEGGAALQARLVGFVAQRMTGVGGDLKAIVAAIQAGRGISRIRSGRPHAERLLRLAVNPTPETMLDALEGILADRSSWWLYRRECVFQLRDALRECGSGTLADLSYAVAAVRTRARHRGRRTSRRSIGTPLLLKGLEFDHGILFWDPQASTKQELYVALTRASKSLTIVSQDRVLRPAP
jgi:DNA helicase-2/ATP-dependent DNA helicase PcrA